MRLPRKIATRLIDVTPRMPSVSCTTAPSISIDIFDKVVVDVSNGHITYPSSGKREEWTVAQTNANENDYVLFRKSSRRLINNKAVADAVTRFIRIRATAGEQPRFMAYGLSYLVTGTCAVVQ